MSSYPLAYDGTAITEDDNGVNRLQLLGSWADSGAPAARLQRKLVEDEEDPLGYNVHDTGTLVNALTEEGARALGRTTIKTTPASWYFIGFAVVIVIIGCAMMTMGTPSQHGQRLAGMFTVVIGLLVLAYVPRTMLRVRR